jgi:hypothetical protein
MKPAHIFETLSRMTWERLRLGDELEVSQGEEGITDMILLILAAARIPEVFVIKTPKIQEAAKGTDWEWWIGSSRLGWLRYAVQAKSIDVKSLRYPRLTHKVSGQYQLDVLEKYAKTNKAIARYCFYNYVPNATQTSWQCSLRYDPIQFGCTIATTRVVRTAIKTHGCKNFRFIHSDPRSKPLRCLVRCPMMQAAYRQTEDAPAGIEGTPLYKQLPSGFEDARETGQLTEFDPDFYVGEIELYPKRILLVDNGDLINTFSDVEYDVGPQQRLTAPVSFDWMQEESSPGIPAARDA